MKAYSYRGVVINEKTQFVVIWFCKTSGIPLDNRPSAIIHYLCGGSTGTRDFTGGEKRGFGGFVDEMRLTAQPSNKMLNNNTCSVFCQQL